MTVVEGISIKYIFKQRKYDNNHLVIVFSGFGGNTEFTFDFLNVFQNVNANVLWIKDEFYEHCSYYLAHNNDFSIENSIIKFIEQNIKSLGITKKDVTIIGASKGGSAALYYGLKYDFKNIIATVPQLLVGAYAKNSWPHVYKHMLGDEGDQKYFDSLIINLLKSEKDFNKNIYLLTSTVDIQYKDHISPFLSYFYKYNNFNLLYSESILVREHNQVTGHHVDVLLGIVTMLSSNVIPRLGSQTIYGDASKREEEKHEVYVDLKNIYFEKNKLFLDGVGIVRGKDAKDYSDINYRLILVSKNSKEIIIPLAKAHRPYLTRMFYSGNLYIYDKCWFTTYQYAGVSLVSIPKGQYDLFLEILIQGEVYRERLNRSKEMVYAGTFEIKNMNNGVSLLVK